MNISTFMEQFNLHDSWLENIGFSFFKDQLVLTVILCNWAQDHFRQGIDEDQVIGNFIFKGVKNIDLDIEFDAEKGLEIMNVSYIQSDEGLDVITFVIEVGKHEDILLLSFQAKEVEWIPLEAYYDA